MDQATPYPSFMNGSANNKHDRDVRFMTEDLGRLDGFDLRRIVNEGSPTIYIASGACPGCQAPGQQGIGRPKVRLPGIAPWIEVLMNCECGFDHGEKGSAGCGRTWTVGALVEDWLITDG